MDYFIASTSIAMYPVLRPERSVASESFSFDFFDFFGSEGIDVRYMGKGRKLRAGQLHHPKIRHRCKRKDDREGVVNTRLDVKSRNSIIKYSFLLLNNLATLIHNLPLMASTRNVLRPASYWAFLLKV